MTLDEIRTLLDSHAVVPLWPEAGRALGLTRGHTYRCAEAGDIEVIPMGRLKRVPTSWLRRRLGLEEKSPKDAA
jgi:hypothetical protein